jgi:hypothetical protein
MVVSEDARRSLERGVNVVVDAVKVTLIPGRPRSDEEVEPWAYAMVAVECAEANGDFVAVGPLAN